MNRKIDRIFGYGFDFWIYVVGQHIQESTFDTTRTSLGKLKYDYCEYNSPDSFAFPVCDCEGVFYNVVSSYGEEAGTIFIKETPRNEEHYFCVPWKSTEEMNDVRNIMIDTEYQEDLAAFIGALIELSPVRKIYIQIRCQGLEKHNMIGMLNVRQFCRLMEQDQLLGNMVYVIYDPLTD